MMRPMPRNPFLVVPLVVLALVAAACGSDGSDPTAGSSASITTVAPATTTTAAPTTEVPITEVPTTVAETTTTSTTVVETTTTAAPAPAAWAPTADWPSLADLPCCASNWTGTPSPAFPDDPAAALAPGIYSPSRVSAETITGDSLDLVVRRFEACSVIPAEQNNCEDNGGFADTEMGVVDDPAREQVFSLDASTTVVFTGFDCEGPPARWSIDGAGFAEFSTAFDTAYQTLLAGPFLAGETADALQAALSSTPTGGFSAPCPDRPGAGALQWQWEQSPEATVLMQVLFPGSEENGFTPAPPPSAASYWLIPSALQVGDDGALTLYVYAGFYS
jgi:hypothetical protein